MAGTIKRYSDLISPSYKFGPLMTQANNCLCLPIIYGEAKVAGNKIWQDSGTSSFNTIIAFSEGEIERFYDVRINDETYSSLGATESEYKGTTDQTIDSRVTGTTQADKAAVVGGLKNVAYLAMTVKSGQKVSNTYCNITAKILGKKINVYTNTTTYTSKFSNNPAWCMLDFLASYNGCKLGYNSSGNFDNTIVNQNIDVQSFIDAAAYCAAEVSSSNATGTVNITNNSKTVAGTSTKFTTEIKVGDKIVVDSQTKEVVLINSDTNLETDSNFTSTKTAQVLVIKEARFVLNLILDERRTRLDWLNEMLVCCRGSLVYNGNKLALKIEQDELPIQTFDSDNIIADSEVFWTVSKLEKPDIAKVRYIDPNKDYARIFAIAEASSYNNIPPLIHEFQTYGVTNFKQASRLAWFYLNQARTCDKYISFRTTKEGLDRTVGDVIDITSTFLNYTNKKMRIVRIAEAQEGQIQLICREYNGGNFAKLTTNLTGTNNDLTYTSKKANEDANDITVSYVNPGQASQSLNISVTGTAITVNLGTNGSGNINSTANNVITAIQGSSGASALVTVANASGNDGTGVVTATSIMTLTGGTSGIYADTLGSVAPVVNTVTTGQETPSQRSVTLVVAANNSLNKGGADFVVADYATNAQDTINDAIEAIPLSTEISGSVSSVILNNQVPVMTSNTSPSGVASANSVNTYAGTSNIIPTMTSNTAPSGIASASSVYFGDAAWCAMDKNNGTQWINNGGVPGWIQYQFTSAKIIGKYTITSRLGFYASQPPKNWTLEGSNNGTDWTTLDTQTNQTGWAGNEKRTFTFSNSTAHSYYRLNITASQDNAYISIAEWELFESISYDAWKALNHTNTDQYDSWQANTTTGYLEYQFASAKTIVNYAISSINAADQTLSPKTWTLKGSNNGTDWTTLDTQTNITSWSQAETKNFSFANTTAYSYYKLDITENNGHANYVAVGELKLGLSSAFYITADSSIVAKDDVYNGTTIKFTSGTQIDQTGLITDFTGSTNLIKIENFTGSSIPSVNDTFDIMDYSGKIVLMEGNYICDDSIVLKSGITIEGQGSGTVLKIKDSLNSNIDLVKNSDTAYGNLNCTLSKLCLNGNLMHNTSGTQNAVNFNLVRNSKFDKVFINNFRSLGISLTNCLSITVDSSNITNNDTGIKLISSNYTIISSSISDYNTNSGIYIDAASANNSINNCHTSYNEADSGIVNLGSNNNFIGNICNNNYKYGILNQAASNNKIATNTCNNNKQHGVYIYNGSNSNDISGNTCIGNGLTTDNTYSNIYVDTNCDYNNIQNNIVRSAASGNKPKYGLRVNSSNCDKNIVSNNDMTDANAYGTSVYSDAGTGTVAANNRTTS